MSIKENLERVMYDVQAGVEAGDPSLADRISGEALQALLAGVHSTEWKTLMKNFADANSPKQLERLTFNDPQSFDPAVRRNAIYLAAISICGAQTITKAMDYVNPEILDKTLACQPEPAPAPAPDPA
jgi:hypothetical protein